MRYYCQLPLNGGQQIAVAVLSLYSPPDEDLLDKSFGTLHVSKHLGDERLAVVPIQDLLMVVGMMPWHGGGDRFYVAEKMGMDTSILSGEIQDNGYDQDDENGDVAE